MQKREALNVYFKMDGKHYLLFQTVNIGDENKPDLKFTGFGKYFWAEDSRVDKSIPKEENLLKNSIAYDKIELTYHYDGVYLRKLPGYLDKSKIYLNPFGAGNKWTPMREIIDFQPVINIAIRTMDAYRPEKIENQSKKSFNYICENDDLFESSGKYLVVVYIRHKSLPICRFTRDDVYSDILCKLNSDLDLCIMIQRHQYDPPKTYYSDTFKGYITPYERNSFNFCSKDTSKDEISDKLRNVFDENLCYFLYMMNNGDKFIHLNEEKLLLIDQVDIFYQNHRDIFPIKKAHFIRKLLEYTGDKLSDFNSLNDSVKQQIILKLFLQLKQKPEL